MTRSKSSARAVFVTGASGAGRTTAINALEDIGFDAINNIPLSLLERVFEGGATLPPMAIGLDVRNRDFSVDGVLALLNRVEATIDIEAEVLFLDCRPDILIRRYSETRRRHPLAPEETPETGIAREMDILKSIRHRADHLIDTSEMTPHQLRAEIATIFGGEGFDDLVVSVESFSYKRGLPRGQDLIFDVRFLKNPHWAPELRASTGQDPKVAEYVASDDIFEEFFEKLTEMLLLLLPAYRSEGKTNLTVGIGCTGGQHRSVTVAEKLSNALAEQGWRVSTRHRELERQGRGASA
ncbi:MAG: RNase adapter RapZ [Paracoccaceae bacterium]|nr:RNase adapter RapZ [Paracoccaceae bacterium]